MELVKTFKALSDETRFQLFKLLLTHDLCVEALARNLKISEAAVSQHLKQLREAGLVRGEKRGYWTHYMIDKVKLNELAEAVKDLTKLPPCPEGSCNRKLNPKTNSSKEDKTMCDCRCHHPQELNGKPDECNPRQTDRGHGSIKSHPCVPRTKKEGDVMRKER
jgi:DNA-binding transcriptional ArsR family regulator